MKANYILLAFLFLSVSTFSQVDTNEIEFIPEEIRLSIEKQNEENKEQIPEGLKDIIFSSVISKSKIWNEGSLKVSFKGGNTQLHKLIAETANIWTQYGDITFDFGYDPINQTFRTWKPQDTSHIRIGFELPGNWSLIGNTSVDWKIIPKGYVSLNLSDFDKSLPYNWEATVLHEFGHALGFMHEHQSPDNVCDFNWPVVYEELGKKPNSWSKRKSRCQYEAF